MTNRLQQILDGCGDGNPVVNISREDAQSVGLEAGQYTAKDLRKALSSAAANQEKAASNEKSATKEKAAK